ncbi:MAG: hypothetical protein K2N13_06245, partial [Paraprevotella sp.]|nr:hypothetical protein [Paraprevotella sp.]
KCLFLMMALLAGTTLSKSYAGDGNGSTGEENVDPTNIKSYDGLKQVVGKIQKAKDLQNLHKEAVGEEDRVKKRKPYNSTTTEIEKITYTNPLLTHLSNFVSLVEDKKIKTPCRLSYRIREQRQGLRSADAKTVYITLTDSIDAVNKQLPDMTTNDPTVYNRWMSGTSWIEISPDKVIAMLGPNYDGEWDYDMNLSEDMENPKFPKYLCIYYWKWIKNEETGVVTGDYYRFSQQVSNSGECWDIFRSDYVDIIKTFLQSVHGLSATEEIKKEVPTQEYEAWEAEYNTAVRDTVISWKNLSEFENYYKTTTNPFIIGANIEIPEDKVADLVWPVGYTLNGGGNKIVGTQPIFATNNGTILNLIAPEGRIATDNNGKAKDCIVKVSGGWRVYDDEGNYASNLSTTLESAVYQLRNNFGYDLSSRQAGKLTPATKLYSAKNKAISGATELTFNVNVTDEGALVYGNGNVVIDNTVVYVEDADITERNINTANVAVPLSDVTQEGDKYTCSKVELKDGANVKEFYMPYSVTTKEVSYVRKATTNKVPVCLPFELNDAVKQTIAKNIKIAVEDVFYYTFRDVQGDVIWFTPLQTVAPNEPCLIAFRDGVSWEKDVNMFEGIPVERVDDTPVITDLKAPTLQWGDNRLFGNYKPKQVFSALLKDQAGNGAAAYCYINGKLKRMEEDLAAGKATTLNQFRSYVILKEDIASPNSLPDSFEIGFVDEDGNEVTGIGSVDADDSGFKAVGGNGVIAISADKACEVKVYTAGGSLAKAVRVEAGRTTLPFSAGMYIVNQTKVVVK